MLDLECQLVQLFGWSLRDLDETDIESLIPFFRHYARWRQRGGAGGRQRVYADQAGFLPGF